MSHLDAFADLQALRAQAARARRLAGGLLSADDRARLLLYADECEQQARESQIGSGTLPATIADPARTRERSEQE
jgi:hypothetical protein